LSHLSEASRARDARFPVLHLALAALALLGASCSDREAEERAALEALVAREQAAALFSDTKYGEALAALEPLLARKKPEPEDLVRAACVRLALDAQPEAARAELQRALELGGETAAIHYNLARTWANEGELERALEHYRRAHELAPADLPAHLAYASTLQLLDRMDEAERELRKLLEVPVEHAGSWRLPALYRLSRVLIDSDRWDEARALEAERDLLTGRGLVNPQTTELQIGTLGVVRASAPAGTRIEHAPAALGFKSASTRLGDFAGLTGVQALDLRGAWSVEIDADGKHVRSSTGAPALLGHGPTGLVLAERANDGSWQTRRLSSEPIQAVVALELDATDLRHDANPPSASELALLRGGQLELARLGAESLEPLRFEPPLPELPSGARGLLPLDYDHDGDVDVLVHGDFGLRLLRNDGARGAPLPGGFVDATQEAGLAQLGAVAWCQSEDLDTDQDVDLLIGAQGRTLWADNLRGGRFELREGLAPAARGATRPLLADFDGDARPDLYYSGAQPRLARGSAGARTLEQSVGSRAALDLDAGAAVLVDVDLDGAVDALVPSAPGAANAGLAVLALGLPEENALPLEGAATLALASADFDADGRPDLALLRADGLELRFGARLTSWEARGVRIALRGLKDNARGLGAIVELRAGRIYRRTYWRGEPIVLGLGERAEIDVLRFTWPNGVTHSLTKLPAGSERLVAQASGLVGSCPFLYTWNGSRFEFITDVLGITPLGLPMAPGQLVPPDHDEYVLVRGEQLAPRDGFLELVLTEELREVTYLDRARLEAIDHPADTSIYPNELFCFPPFPKPHVHSVRAPLSPTKAVDGAGRDWSAELAREDGQLAQPFDPLPGPHQGLASEHVLELAFDPAAVAQASKLRLVMTGWFYWTDASVNVSAARTPGVQFLPPLLELPDGNGGWRPAGPPLGFPAGKLKTMVVELDGLLSREDPRLRLRSTLRLHWDALLLAVDGDDAPLARVALEPASAELWERGFSEGIDYASAPGLGLEWFDWDRLQAEPRWNQHPGLYTRHGDVLALLGAADDRFAILGAGDALTLRFDASALPPLAPGMRRDYLLYLDGWAKDRDPNTVEALSVEPLPFHGMSAYPYPPSESFPDTPEHRAWRKEWNTRPAKQWIEPLAPGAGN